jgi:hypothetical protein
MSLWSIGRPLRLWKLEEMLSKQLDVIEMEGEYEEWDA